MCSFVVPDAKQFGIKKIQVDEQIGINDLSTELAIAFADTMPTDCSEATLDEQWAEQADERINEAWQSLALARKERSAPPIDPDIYNPPEDWRSAVAHAVQSSGRHGLARMILPPQLATVLRDIDYRTIETLDLARTIADLRIDRGSLARQARRLSGSDIPVGLALWTDPSVFAITDWPPLVIALFEDRMTARAIRYAALRLRTARLEEE